jgi:dolichol-phosphate mannosyltransferase
MASNVPKLSIVCPAYQEEEVLPLFHQELCSVLAEIGNKFEIEILYVDDGSRDRTLAVIRELARGDRRVRYLSFSRNFGHQAALTAGLEHAQGEVILMMDSDLQHPPALIPTLLEKWGQGYEIVLTIREDDPGLGLFKRLSSRLFYQVMGWLSDTEIRFSAADFRLMSRRAVHSLLELRETHRFLRGMVQWLGFPTVEVPFKPISRKAGLSKYTLRRMMNFALDAVLSFSRLPLRLSMVLGSVSVGVSFVITAYAGMRLFWHPAEFSWSPALVLVSLYLVGGGILCGLGIVGEYVGRIYEQVKARPLYVLKEQSPEERSDAPTQPRKWQPAPSWKGPEAA